MKNSHHQHPREDFTAAWSDRVPGAMTHPGPRHNSWDQPISPEHRPPDAAVPIAEVLDTLWKTGGYHLNPATGAPGTTTQRAIPSAGACYPVQVHLLCGVDCDVPPGIHAYNTEDSTTHRRAGSAPGMAGAVVVFTVLPQRTAAKYHHRALPLLLADTAYALVGVAHHAASRGLRSRWLTADPASLAVAARLPDYARWQEHWPGTGPELAIAALAVGAGEELPVLAQWASAAGPVGWPQPCPARQPRTLAAVVRWAAGSGLHHPESTQELTPTAGVSAADLRRRRSLPLPLPPTTTSGRRASAPRWETLLTDFPLPAPPGCEVLVLDQDSIRAQKVHLDCAGQEWIGALEGMLLFRTRCEPDETSMWWAAGAAAHLLYSVLAAERDYAFRPVAGWTGTRDGFTTLHALGFRAPPLEGTTHVGE
ncbi:nitroreductase family protein [Arthrobacter sp. TMN-49]